MQAKLRIIQPNDIYEQEANRIAADSEIREFTNRKSTSTPILQCKEDKRKPPKKSPIAKPQPTTPHWSRVRCDVKVDPRDQNDFLLQKSFRVVGMEVPQIGVLIHGQEEEFPCLVKALKAHEDQHVKNNLKACQAFRKCIDENSSRPLFGLLSGDPRISYDDFVRCHNTHHGGTTGDCIADEKSAYEVSIKKANDLKNERRCAEEKSLLNVNIEYWERIRNNAPNCDTSKR